MFGGKLMRCATFADHCSRQRTARQRGFSLIEILIAMVVAIIGLAGLLSLHITTVQGNSRATRSVTASTIAHQTMEELRSLPVQPPFVGYLGPTLQSQFGIPCTDIALPPVTGQDNTSYARRVSLRVVDPGGPLQNLLIVRVEVIWADQGAAATTTNSRLRHEVMLESMRTVQDIL
jgi:prepilin-type N-terminal cleavage/methylation domain-containing protein